MTSFTKRSGTSFTLRPASAAGGVGKNSLGPRARDGTRDVEEQRMRFVVAASRREKTLTELCAEFEISRPTGYGWLKRYQTRGITGMQEASRRPHHSPARTAAGLEQRGVELRGQRPGWGARKIRHLLGKEGIELPASTIHRIFLRHQLVRDWDRQPMALRRFERAEPNQLWQMDFKGPKGWDQPVGPLSVLDDHSRYALALENTGSTQGARGTGRAGASVPRKRRAGRNADGSRHALVQHPGTHGLESVYGVADGSGCEPALQRLPASADPGQGGTVSSQPDRGSIAPGHARRQRSAK